MIIDQIEGEIVGHFCKCSRNVRTLHCCKVTLKNSKHLFLKKEIDVDVLNLLYISAPI